MLFLPFPKSGRGFWVPCLKGAVVGTNGSCGLLLRETFAYGAMLRNLNLFLFFFSSDSPRCLMLTLPQR